MNWEKKDNYTYILKRFTKSLKNCNYTISFLKLFSTILIYPEKYCEKISKLDSTYTFLVKKNNLILKLKQKKFNESVLPLSIEAHFLIRKMRINCNFKFNWIKTIVTLLFAEDCLSNFK
jgi:hypothetical protein